jgi:hypothetical protein
MLCMYSYLQAQTGTMRKLNAHLMPFKEVFAYSWCKAILCERLTLNESHCYEMASGICAKPWTQNLPSHSHLVTGQAAKYLHLATVNADCGIQFLYYQRVHIKFSLSACLSIYIFTNVINTSCFHQWNLKILNVNSDYE